MAKCLLCADHQKCLDNGYQRKGNHKYCYKEIVINESKCNKCGKDQVLDKRTENWTFYQCGIKCDCGGEFVMWLNGKPLKRGDE